MGLTYSPSGVMSAKRLSRFARGTRTDSNHSRPLSMPLRPSFSPLSSMRTPGHGAPSSSRIGTTTAWTPWCCPATTSCANTDREAAVECSVADVLLVGAVVGREDDELTGIMIVGRRRLETSHVGAVAELGHGEAAEQFSATGFAQIAIVVRLRPKGADGAAEEPELYAELDDQREVGVGDGLEGNGELAHVAFAAVFGRVGERAETLGRDHFQSFEGLLAEDFLREAELAPKDRGLEHAATRSRVLAYLPSSRRCNAATSSGSGEAGAGAGRPGRNSRAASTLTTPRGRFHAVERGARSGLTPSGASSWPSWARLKRRSSGMDAAASRRWSSRARRARGGGGLEGASQGWSSARAVASSPGASAIRRVTASSSDCMRSPSAQAM